MMYGGTYIARPLHCARHDDDDHDDDHDYDHDDDGGTYIARPYCHDYHHD